MEYAYPLAMLMFYISCRSNSKGESPTQACRSWCRLSLLSCILFVLGVILQGHGKKTASHPCPRGRRTICFVRRFIVLRAPGLKPVSGHCLVRNTFVSLSPPLLLSARWLRENIWSPRIYALLSR